MEELSIALNRMRSSSIDSIDSETKSNFRFLATDRLGMCDEEMRCFDEMMKKPAHPHPTGCSSVATCTQLIEDTKRREAN